MVYILLKLSFHFIEYSFFKTNEISKLMQASESTKNRRGNTFHSDMDVSTQVGIFLSSACWDKFLTYHSNFLQIATTFHAPTDFGHIPAD